MSDLARINWHPKGAWNQLHLAASQGDVPTVLALIRLARRSKEDAKLEISGSKVSKLDIPTKNGDRAVQLAFRKGMGDAAVELIKAGCDITTPGANGESLLHIAASKGMINEIRYLTKERQLDINSRTPDGSTCVHYAAAEGRCDTLRELANLGVPLDAENAHGDTALHVAARNDCVGAVQWLLSEQPNLLGKQNKQGKDAEAVARDAGRRHAAAAIKDFREAKKRLIRSLIDFQRMLTSGEDLNKIKQWLSRFTKEEDLAFLVDGPTKAGSNSFLEACAGGNIDVVRWLWSQPGKREIQNTRTGATALQIAAARGHLEIVKFFVDELDFDPSREDAKHVTPIQEALQAGHTEIIKILRASEERHAAMRQPSSSSRATSSSTPRSVSRQISEASDLSSTEGIAKVVPLKRGSSGASTSSTHSVPDEQLISFLKRAELSTSYAAQLHDRGFGTMKLLEFILEADLKDMKMPTGHRRAFLHHLAQWKEEYSRKQKPEPVPSNPQPENSVRPTDVIRKSAQTLVEVGATSLRPKAVHLDDLKSNGKLDLEDGERLELIVPYQYDSTNFRVFTLCRTGRTYTCTCHAWRMQTASVLPEKRTCIHLRELRGEEEEEKRTGRVLRSAVTASSLIPSSALDPGNGSGSNPATNGLNPRLIEGLQAMRQQRNKQTLQDFPQHLIVRYNELDMLDDILGEGSFGVVRIAQWRGTMVAVKEFKSTNPFSREQDESSLKREALLMSRVCNHDNVVPLVGIVVTPVLAVVMKYMPGGSVEDLLVVPGPRNCRNQLPWYGFLKLMRDAAAGVLHLHKQNVIHRDISARNLLVDATGTVRLSDFGFARISERDTDFTVNTTGPYKWMSPEAFEGVYSQMSDVFAFGVTMWEILKGQRPWKQYGLTKVYEKVKNDVRMELPRVPDPALPALISRCWAGEPNDRPLMDEVFSIIDKAWIDAKGHLARDPSGGLARIINSDAFIAARSEPPMQVADFASGDDAWFTEDPEGDDAVFSIRERPSFGYTGTPAPDEFAQQTHVAVQDEGAPGYVLW